MLGCLLAVAAVGRLPGAREKRSEGGTVFTGGLATAANGRLIIPGDHRFDGAQGVTSESEQRLRSLTAAALSIARAIFLHDHKLGRMIL